MGLIARHLEENGIATVVVATARDIVEHCGVARLLFVDFPLGAPCGEPWNVAQQRDILAGALDLLESAPGPRTTVEAGHRWSAGDAWKARIFTREQPYMTAEAEQAWMDRKEAYRRLRDEGNV